MAYLEEDGPGCAEESADDQLRNELKKRREISVREVEHAKERLRIHSSVVQACEAALGQLEKKESARMPDEFRKAML